MLPGTVALQFGSLVKEKEVAETRNSLDAQAERLEEEGKEQKGLSTDTEKNLGENEMSHEFPEKPKRNKADIWRKRTVGEIFEAALQRYQERKAQRQTYGKG